MLRQSHVSVYFVSPLLSSLYHLSSSPLFCQSILPFLSPLFRIHPVFHSCFFLIPSSETPRKRKNLPPQLNQNRLHRILPLPLRETGQARVIDFARTRIDAGEIDARTELHSRRRIGICVAAVDGDAVDAVFVDGLHS